MKKKIFMLISVITFAILMSSPMFLDDAQENVAQIVEEEYIVHKYDTLWTILKTKIGERKDVREFIYLTTKRNGLENVQIFPGQKIILILPKE